MEVVLLKVLKRGKKMKKNLALLQIKIKKKEITKKKKISDGKRNNENNKRNKNYY